MRRTSWTAAGLLAATVGCSDAPLLEAVDSGPAEAAAWNGTNPDASQPPDAQGHPDPQGGFDASAPLDAGAAHPFDAARDVHAPPGACPSSPPSGARARLVASQGVTLDGSGGVSVWDSANGGGVQATQTDATARPTVLPSAAAGLPALHFDGNQQFLWLAYDPNGTDQMTITAVSRTWRSKLADYNPDCDFSKTGLDDLGRELNCSGTDSSVIAWNEANNAFAGHGIFYGVGQQEVTFRFGTGQEYRWFKAPFVLQTPNEDRFVWSMAVMAGAQRTFSLDGMTPKGYLTYDDQDAGANLVALSTRSDLDESGASQPSWPSVVSSTDTMARIGKGRFDSAPGYWAGDLAELIVYDRALSAAEQSALQTYVSCRYFGATDF